MRGRNTFLQTAFMVVVSFLFSHPADAQAVVKYPLTQFDSSGCMAKGRVQDCSGKVMRRILTDGKHAIPILISQLTETTRTNKQIADYWSDTRSGDVAFVVLTDLFTQPNSEASEMPDVPDWNTVLKGCRRVAQACWDEYLQKHGRHSVKQAWLRAWSLHEGRVYWDAEVRCFRLRNN